MHPTDVHLHSEEMAACNYILTACVKSSTVECDAGGVETKLRPQGDVTGTSNLAHIVLPVTIVYMPKKSLRKLKLQKLWEFAKIKAILCSHESREEESRGVRRN